MRGGAARPALTVVFALTYLLSVPGAGAATIKVTETADDFFATPGGACSLREAVQTANTDSDFGACVRVGTGTKDTLKLRGGETYGRTRAGIDDTNVNGDLDIAGDTVIAVKGSGMAKINAQGLDRVLHVLAGGKLKASKLRIVGGAVATQPTTVGGGILNQGGKLILRSSTVTGNAIATNANCICGGGVGAAGGSTKIVRSAVKTNTSPNLGGGVAFLDGKLKVLRSTVRSNQGSLGGGISVSGGAGDTVTVLGSTVADNTAAGSGLGGGFYVSGFGGTTTRIENSTISGNRAQASGGGIYESGSFVDGNALTITDNTADSDGNGSGQGGGISANGAAIRNSIIIGNHHNLAPANADCAGSFIPAARNLVAVGTGCFAGDSNVGTAKPRIKRLGSYGGPTKTHALKRRSPAVGRAGSSSAPRRDQRGKRRDEKPDIGAFER